MRIIIKNITPFFYTLFCILFAKTSRNRINKDYFKVKEKVEFGEYVLGIRGDYALGSSIEFTYFELINFILDNNGNVSNFLEGYCKDNQISYVNYPGACSGAL